MYTSKRCFGEYNSLDDYYLQGYFTNKQLRKQLRRAGLMNRDGAPVPEAIYRTNVVRAERRRRAKDELTKCLVAESINLQRQYENEIKSRLDEIAKLERVRKLRLETRPICQRAQTKVRKKDLKYYLTTMDKKDLWRPHTVFECQLGGHAERIQFEGDQRICPHLHIKTLMTIQYLGDGNDRAHPLAEGRREIYVEQMIYRQKPLWVYLGQHKPLDFFKFNTYRHPTFPFCLNMYINGMLHLRIHTCCEYKFPIGTRLGGPSGKFVLLDVQGTTTCGRCQCITNKSIIPNFAETMAQCCNKGPGVTVEIPTCSCEKPCHDCHHVDECRCTCGPHEHCVHVCDSGTTEECDKCIEFEADSSQPEGSSECPCNEEEQEQEAPCECQCQHQCHCNCQCHCHHQSETPEECVCTEQSGTSEQQCICLQKSENDQSCQCANQQGANYQVEVSGNENSQSCKCSSDKEDTYSVEVYDLGTSSNAGSEKECAPCCKGKKKKEESKPQVVECPHAKTICPHCCKPRPTCKDPPQIEVIECHNSKGMVERCCKKSKPPPDTSSECSCRHEPEVKEECDCTKEEDFVSKKLEYGDYMLEIKKVGDSRSEKDSDRCICSDRASQGSSVRRGYSTCCDTNESDTEDVKCICTTNEETTVCTTCNQLKKIEPKPKIVHIVDKPIQMNITIEGYCKKERKQAAPATCVVERPDTMQITVCCEDNEFDGVSGSGSSKIEEEPCEAEPKGCSQAEPRCKKAVEPAKPTDLQSVDHSRTDTSSKSTEIPIEVVSTVYDPPAYSEQPPPYSVDTPSPIPPSTSADSIVSVAHTAVESSLSPQPPELPSTHDESCQTPAEPEYIVEFEPEPMAELESAHVPELIGEFEQAAGTEPIMEPKPEPITELEPIIEVELENIAESEPIAESKSEPIAGSDHNVIAESKPEPNAKSEPELIAKSEPIAESEPIAKSEPEPIPGSETKPVAESEPEPITESESKPIAESEPKPIAESEPKPIVESEPKTIVESEPKPIAEFEPKPTAESEPKPIAESESEPIAESEPKPIAESESEPIAESEPKPIAESKSEPIVESEPPAINEATETSVVNISDAIDKPITEALNIPEVVDESSQTSESPDIPSSSIEEKPVTHVDEGQSDTPVEPPLDSQSSKEKLINKIIKIDAGTDPIPHLDATTQIDSSAFQFDKSTETTFHMSDEEDKLSLITSYENSVLWKKSSIFPPPS